MPLASWMPEDLRVPRPQEALKDRFQVDRAVLRRFAKGGDGFTLVELLVTVAIILVLAALAFMGFGRVRQAAMKAKALGPLKQVAAANAAYAMENYGQINTLRWVGDPEEGRPFVSNSFWGRTWESAPSGR